MIALSLVPGLGYIFLGWLNNIVMPALLWYILLIFLSIWGYRLFKEFTFSKMAHFEVIKWHKKVSIFNFLMFASWAFIFVLYSTETQSKMHYIAIFTEIGASVVATTLLFPDRKTLKPILYILMIPLAFYFVLIGELYSYILTLFTLILLGVLFYSANSSDKLLQKTHYQASHDQLTGLFNRHAFIDILQQKVNGLEKYRRFSYLLLIDLDHFKTINDTLGHDIGDKILQEVSARLKQTCAKENLVSRLGGDEFVVLGSDLDSEEDALQAAMQISNKLLDNLKATYHIKDHHLYLSASVGASLLSDKKLDANTFIKEADIAMYEVKEKGRDGVILFNNELAQRVENKLELEQKLHFSLSKNEIFLNYQAQTNPNEEVIGCEVLARWKNKELGLIPPDTFISIAEQTGFMIELGSYILEESFKTFKDWDEKGIKLEQFSINISMRQFFYYRFVDEVKRLCKKYLNEDLSKRLVFEMTETLLAEDIPKVISTINSLSPLGIHFSMDDFGTGYSSLSYLEQLPIHELKIDRSFINQIDKDHSNTKMVKIILNMAKAFDLRVVAEGVETPQQSQYLSAHGCDILQGYLFSKPLSKDDFETYYQSNKDSSTK